MSTGGSDEVVLPAERREVLIRVADEDSLREVLRRPLDFGCRPVVNLASDGSAEVPAIVTDEVLARLREEGMDVEVLEARDLRAEVSGGDRFADGTVVPRGLGEKTGGPSA
jgi:hypothetical protein